MADIGPVFPNNVISKCPAIIFAVNRTAKVPGRITLLIVSMQTMKGIKTAGVPWGTKWANICWVWLIHPYNIKLNHKGKAKAKVKVKWLVLVKIYGNKPKKLLNIIKENKEINIKVLPLCPDGPSKVLNSLCKVNKILFQTTWNRFGNSQKEAGIKNNPKKVLNQLSDKFKIVVDGSNTENKFVIIFNLIY